MRQAGRLPASHRRPRTASRLRGRRAAVPLHRCTAGRGPAPRSCPARPRMDRRALSRRTPRRPICRARGPRGDRRPAQSRRGLTPASACQRHTGTARSRAARRSPTRTRSACQRDVRTTRSRAARRSPTRGGQDRGGQRDVRTTRSRAARRSPTRNGQDRRASGTSDHTLARGTAITHPERTRSACQRDVRTTRPRAARRSPGGTAITRPSAGRLPAGRVLAPVERVPQPTIGGRRARLRAGL